MSNIVPEGWDVSRLVSIANLTMGQSPSSDTYNTEAKGLPFFQGKADFGPRSPKIRYWCSEPTKVAGEGSILFSVRAPVGEVNITPHQCCIGRGLAGIKADSVDQEFLFQKLQYVKPRFELLSQGSTFEAVNGGELKEFKLTLPPLPEQQKIAAILSSVDDVIEKTRAQIDKLKDMKTGMMQELLTKGIGHTEFKDSPVGRIPAGWDVSELKEYLSFISYGFTNPMPESIDGPYMVTARDINDLKVNYDSARKTTEKAYEELLSNKSRPYLDDILLTKDGTLGRVALVDKKNVCINQSVAVLRPNEKVNPKFLLFLLASPIYQREMLDKAGGSTIKHIYITVVDKMVVAIPELEEQIRIVNILDALLDRIVLTEKKLRSYENTKKALMQDLLTGKVRVKIDENEKESAVA